jgi:iturin family lipopeptide synthetase A
MNQTITSAFNEASVRHASALAVTDGTRNYTYLELADGAARIAGFLTERDRTADGAVGLFLAQNADVVAAMLGVLQSGSMYVPLDRYFPASRLCTIVSEGKIRKILTSKDLLEKAQEVFADMDVQYMLMEDALRYENSEETSVRSIQPQDIAYVLYTSGTTGKPKGVLQSHANVVHHCTAFGNLVRINEGDIIAVTTSYSHCVAVIDIFSVLFKGGCVAVYDLKANTDLMALRTFVVKHGVTIIHTIPSLFRATFGAADAQGIRSVRLVVLGGEDVHIRDFELFKSRFPDKAVFVNLYGSTELIIATACLLNKKSKVSRNRISAGFPMEGVTYRIVNDHNESQGTLSVGEIEFQSDFVSPGSGPERLPVAEVYRSGDLGRVLPDGTLELMGRADTQIKINGNRIELLEIEAAADSLPGVTKAVIKAFDRNDFEKFIVCFFTSTQVLDVQTLRGHLSTSLPAYMVPEQWVVLDAFPRTVTGKINRAALSPVLCLQQSQDHHFADDGEREMAELWGAVLEHRNFGPMDPFLVVGGNSLKLSQLHLMLNERYPDTVSVQDLFDNSSIRTMARLIAERSLPEPVGVEVTTDIEI